jgi:ribA/ribD-fused uncharacterized protein
MTPTHIFFYGIELQSSTSRFQNWYPSLFADPSYPGVHFATAEQYIMYRKSLLMNDHTTAQLILSSHTPLEAGKLGRKVKNYDSTLWAESVDGVAERCYMLKFGQVQECRDALLGTGEKVLAEASPSDRNWGIGFAGHEALGREEEWGRNIAGRALMRVRKRLRMGESIEGDEQVEGNL